MYKLNLQKSFLEYIPVVSFLLELHFHNCLISNYKWHNSINENNISMITNITFELSKSMIDKTSEWVTGNKIRQRKLLQYQTIFIHNNICYIYYIQNNIYIIITLKMRVVEAFLFVVS